MGLFNFNFIVPDNGANGTAGSALSLFRVAPVRFGSWFRYSMKQAVLASTLAATSRPVNFTQMVEADIPALRRYARAVTRDSDIADDIVQDTLVRALRSEHLFQGDKIHSWLLTILINLNRNRLRSLARRPRISSIKENDASDFAGPEAGGRDIERALSTLTEVQRSALFLVVLEGLSYREVAKLQGVPMGTVMSRLGRARAQIKTYLDGERRASAP
jgi:RNA polymerase sigma-70 factor (ECF subfamily)